MSGWKRFWAGVVLAAVVAAGLAGCSNDEDDRAKPSGAVEVVAGSDASAEIEGVVAVKIPGDSIEGSGTLSLDTTDEVPPLDSPLVAADEPVISIDLEGASLSGPAAVTFTAGDRPDLPGGDDTVPVVVRWDPEAKLWQEQPSVYNPDTGEVTTLTEQFSSWGWLWPAEKFLADVTEAVARTVNTKASRPRCDNEDTARQDGWSITSDEGDRVMWCFGIEGDQRIVRVTNNRQYPVVLTYDGGAFTLAEGPQNDVSVYSLYRSLLEAQGRDTTTPQVALPAGATLTLQASSDVAPGTFGIKTQWDGLAFFAEALDLVWQTLLMTAGGSATPGTAERFIDAITQSDCIRAAILGDGGLNQAETLEETLDASFQFIRTCGTDLAEIAAETAGRSNPIYGIVNWLTTTLISATRQILGATYAAADILASPTGDADYRIQVTQEGPEIVISGSKFGPYEVDSYPGVLNREIDLELIDLFGPPTSDTDWAEGHCGSYMPSRTLGWQGLRVLVVEGGGSAGSAMYVGYWWLDGPPPSIVEVESPVQIGDTYQRALEQGGTWDPFLGRVEFRQSRLVAEVDHDFSTEDPPPDAKVTGLGTGGLFC